MLDVAENSQRPTGHIFIEVGTANFNSFTIHQNL